MINNDDMTSDLVQNTLRVILKASFSVIVTLLLGIAAQVIYNLYLHPLRNYPGPKLWAATRLPWISNGIAGDLTFRIHEFHEAYGPVIRVAPNELSYTTSPAWKAIYAHRSQGAVEMAKDLHGAGLVPSMEQVAGIIYADKENHARMRKTLAHAFSDKALREQEEFLKVYVDKMVAGLRDFAGKEPQDMVKWFNWTTFDVIGDLAFGESFSSLDQRRDHPWVGSLFSSLRIVPWLQALCYYRILFLLKYIVPTHLVESRRITQRHATDKVNRRLAKKEDRKDFLSYVLNAREKDGESVMTDAEIHVNANILVIAGSETSATLLAGALYHLLLNPSTYTRLATEIRTSFSREADITLQSAGELRYLAAVLDESLRIYPPASPSMPRVVPAAGEVIDGVWVPGGTTVGVHQFSTYRSHRNFHSPNSFSPERWLPESTNDPSSPFYGDDRACFQPFSYGPRNCIGRNLAYAEMRLILSRLLFVFDFQLADPKLYPSNERWVERQKVFLIWQKGPLFVEVVERGVWWWREGCGDGGKGV